MAASLTLKKDGEKLTGTITGPQGEVALQGTQKDKAVAVNFSVQTPNGPFAIAMNGTQDGDAITAPWTSAARGRRNGRKAAGRRLRPRRRRRRAGAGGSAGAGPGQAGRRHRGLGSSRSRLGGGTTGTPTVTFKQDGEKLTGHYSSQVLGEQQLTGTVKGNAITFGFEASFDGNAVKVTYTGTVDKDTMKGKVVFGDLGEGTFTGKKK